MATNSILSEKKIKDFAGEELFNKGLQYYTSGLVEDFEYNHENQTIHAVIHGNYGVYSIKARIDNNKVAAKCNCPFDSTPCKHIVAVLLYFVNNKNDYFETYNRQKTADREIRKKLQSLTKDDLITLILSSAQKSSSFKRTLYLQLSVDKQISLKQYFTVVDNAFRKFENNDASTYELCRQFEEIIKQAESANDETRVEILWKIADGILNQLNQYGMDDIPFEETFFSTIDILIQILNSNPKLMKQRQTIIEKLNQYYRMANCGIVDSIGEAIYELSNEHH